MNRQPAVGADAWSRERTLSLNRFGRHISYVAVGSGQPVVLVHGSLQDRRAWRAVASELARTHRVVAYDRAGYGRSDDHGCTVDCIRCDGDDLIAVIVRLRLHRPAVVGSSLGSRVILAALRSAPALLGPSLLHEPAVAMPRSLEVLELFDAGERERAISLFLEDLGLRDDRTERAVRRWAPRLEREIISLLREPADGPPSSSLPIIGLLVSEDAHENIRRSAGRLADSLDGIQEIPLPGGRHDAMVSVPQDFAAACARFLEDATV